jgi:hypothetical protein
VFAPAANNVLIPGFNPVNAPIVSITRGPAVVKGGKTMLPVIQLDPRPANEALTSVATAPVDGFFTAAPYRGAFDARQTWLYNWTASFAYGFTPDTSATTYCTAKTNSLGCVPAIGANGTPSATTGTGFVVSGSYVRNNKSGLLFYGVSGQASGAFQNGVLCVKAPIKRTPATVSGGSPTGNDCTGVYSIDMNAFAVGALGGTPLAALTTPGTVVDCQWWGRDPGFAAPNNTTLTDGLEYVVGP